MANEWTPPSDAVAVKSSFVPPSDAVEVKKKDLSASGSVEPSSERLTTTTTKATVSSFSKGKRDGVYSFPGQDNVIYKKEDGQWFKASKSDYKYFPLSKGNVDERIASLEKNAVSLEQYGFETEPRKEEPVKYQALPKAKPIAKTKTEAQQREQELFETSFKALEKTDPEYLRRKAQSDAIDAKVNQINADFINDNEEDVVPKVQQLIKDYPYLQVNQSGAGYDELEIVNTVTNERKKINLENWTSDRDKEEAKRLSGFLDVQMTSKDYVNQYQKVNNIKEQMQSANPTQRIELSQKLLEEQAKLQDLSNGRYNYAKNDKYKSSAIYDKNAKENVKTDFARLQLQSIDYAEKAKSYAEWNQTVTEARQKGLITEEQYQNDYLPKLAQEKNMLVDERNKINEDFRQTQYNSTSIDQIAANEFAVEAERGNLLTVATYSALQGAENSLRFLLETGDFKDGEFKGLLTEAAPGSISDEYTSGGKMNFLETVVSGLTNSVASAIVGAAIGAPTLGLYAASYVNTKDQMSGPEFADVPEYQKILFSGALGATVGLLEKYGISRVFSKTPAGKGLTNYILKKVLSDVGKEATSETIELAVKKNLSAALTQGLIQVTSAGLIEGSTELLQESADMVYKDVFNKMSDKGQFDNPKSWAGVADRLSQSFILGFAGGAGMQSITQTLQVASGEMNKAQINSIEQLIDSPELKDTFRLNIKDQILSGQISKQEGKAIAERLNEVEGTLNKIPKNVDRFEAFKLINERDEIKKEIAGKDPDLVVVQTERVAEINEQLKQLSKDAVQKQTTSEVSVQPGAESGGEMAQGKPKAGSQEVTQEGQQAQEVNQSKFVAEEATRLTAQENISNEERQSLVDKLYDDPIAYARENNIPGSSSENFLKSLEQQPTAEETAVVEEQATVAETVTPKVEIGGIVRGFETIFGDKDLGDIRNDIPFQTERTGTTVIEKNGNKYAVAWSGRDANGNAIREYGGSSSRPGYVSASVKIDENAKPEQINAAQKEAERNLGLILPTIADGKINAKAINDLMDQQQPATQKEKATDIVSDISYQNNIITNENINDIIDSQDTATKQKIAKSAKLAMKAIPKAKIYLHNNTAEYDAAVGEQTKGEEKGSFIASDGAIHINMQEAFPHTLLHEAFHYVILNKGLDAATLNGWAKGLRSIVKDKELLNRLDKLTRQYSSEEQSEEFITELGAIIGAAKSTLTTSGFQKFKTLINNIAKKIGLPPIFNAASTRQDAVDFINTISRQLVTGDEINSMGISGVIDATNVTRKKSILATGTFERYPVNPNTKVEENVPLSRFDGKKSNVFESDRMTGAFIADDKGNKLFNFFGGIFYPIITGKWWASNTMTKASGIARNSKRDADGYIYGTPIIMKPGSQMSNNDMLLATLELMKMDALKKNSGVTKAELMIYIEKAFDKKKIAGKKNIIKNALKRSNNIEQIFDELEYTLFQEDGFIKDRNGNDILNDNGQRIKSLTFEERKEFVSGVLGDRKVVSDKFPSAGSMSAMAEKFTEPETQKSKNVHDIVIVYRTKGDLVANKSNKKDPFYHKSYPYEIAAVNQDGNSAEIEVFILDGAYNLSEAIKELTKSSGDTFSYEEYYKKVEQGKYKSEKVALAQYGRTAKLSYASGNIKARKKQLVYNSSPKSVEELGKRSGVVYFATDKREADAYAEMNRGKVREFEIPESDISNEQVVLDKINELGLQPKDPQYSIEESNLYELIDDRFDNSLSQSDIKKLFDALKEDGITAFRYKDGAQVVEGTTESIAVIDNRIIAEKSNRKKQLVDFGTAFSMQDATAEITVGKEKDSWGRGQFFREKIENAGDILRELSSRGTKPDPEYLEEKINKLKQWVSKSESGFTEIPNEINTVEEFEKSNLRFSDAVDSWNYTNRFHGEILNKVLKQYESISTYTPEQKNARDLVIDLIKNNIEGLKTKISSVEKTINKIVRQRELPIVKEVSLGLTENQAKTANIKFQKGLSKAQAINAAKDKYDLSVKDRGNTHEQGVESALNDLRKSNWYVESDDIMREEAERELKKFFGEKMKAAPAIKKVMAIKPTKIQVEEMAALKSQIRLEAKAAREAKGDLNTKRKALATAITGMVRQGKLTAVQARSIINKVSRVNLDNPVMVDRLISYAERVFDRADYQETLSKAAKIRKSIKKAMKSKDLQAEVAAVAKKFSSVDPFMVEDIDQYIENAEKMLNAVRPVRETEVPLRQATDIYAISDYTTAEVERQEANKKAELLALNKYLVEAGIVTDDMTAKEIQEMIDIIAAEEYEVENADKKLNFLKNRFEFMSGVIEDMIVNERDIFTDEPLYLTQNEKQLMSEVLKFDIDKLSVKQAAQVLEAMDNFINNGITSGLEAVVKGYIGNENANKLAASGLKSRPLKMYWNKAVGKFFGEQFVSLPLLIERMFPGMKKGLKLMSEMGLTDVIRGAAKADREHKMIVKDYTSQEFSKGKGFKKAENVYERGMIAFLSRNLAGTKTEMRNEFLRRVKMVEESINALMTGSETERKMGEAYQKIFDKLKVSSQDLDVIKANAEQMNLDAVNWMTQQWAEKYSDLSDISLSVYNAILGSDTNYTPDRYKGLDESDIELDEKLLQRGSAFMGGLEYTDKNKSGVLIETTRPKVLPEGRFVSLDFDVNNFSSLKGAMIDIETAPAIRQVDGFIKSDGYKRIVNGDDRKILNRRINNYIIAVKGKNAFNRDSMKSVERLANFLGSLGVGKALGGLDQTVKQTAPVIINTLINAGRFDGLNFEMNAAINRSGMPIANRGIEAISGVESIDALIDKKGTTAAEIAKAIEKISQMYMKALLSKPDVWVARSSFISYYKNYLKTNGMSTDIDWQTHEWNQEAMNYAQMMVDRQQNISDEKLAGSFMNSPDSWKSVTRKVILPFATFIINQKNRMHNDFVALFGRGAETSLEDKKRAARSLVGLSAEMLAYQGIAYFIKTMIYDNIAAWITGEDDEEEKKERSFFGIKMTKKQWNATKFPVKSLVSDVLSPFPLFDDAVVFGFDELMSKFPMISKEDIDKAIQDQNDARALKGQDPMDAEQEANLIKNLKDKNTYAVTFQKESLGRQYGVPGIAFDTYTELADMARLAYTGEFEDDMGFGPKKKYISKKDQELVKWTLLPMVLYSTGLVPKDAGVVSRKVVATVKKRSISETKLNSTNELKTELGRKPKDWEESLVMNTTKKVPTLVEAIKFAERFGGLTESQGKEYAKLIEITGDYGYLDLKRIQEGETADQILKK
jgi:Asp-tRNA(Asn)/Glu-tRNA(Gln) amidotransferase C subunit